MEENVRDQLDEELADYIDTSVIAECILDEMEDQALDLTFENAKEVWLSVLEHLPAQLFVSVDRISQRSA